MSSRRRRRKLKLLRAQEFQCHFCSSFISPITMTIDHWVPRSKGGIDDITNMVAACQPCNARKADIMPEDFVAYKRSKLPARNTYPLVDLADLDALRSIVGG